MTEFTEAELKAYKLLAGGGSSREVSDKLQSEGVSIQPAQVSRIKQELYRKLDEEMRLEHSMESMLDSFDRTKIEFEDSVRRLKRWVDQLDAEGSTFQASIVHRDLLNQINTALRVLGKLQTNAMNIQAKNVNVLNMSDFSQAFKQTIIRWFEEMEVEMVGGKIVFHKPSAELMDDYFRWEGDRMRKANLVKGKESDVSASADSEPEGP